jgi:hypothetical protein
MVMVMRFANANELFNIYNILARKSIKFGAAGL